MNRVNGFNIVGNGATEEYDRPSASQSGSRGYSEFDLDFSTLDSLDYSNFFPPSPPRPYATTAPSLAPLPISITPSQWFVPAPATVVAPTTRSTRSQQDKDTGWTPSTRAIPASAPTAGAKQRASPAEGTQSVATPSRAVTPLTLRTTEQRSSPRSGGSGASRTTPSNAVVATISTTASPNSPRSFPNVSSNPPPPRPTTSPPLPATLPPPVATPAPSFRPRSSVLPPPSSSAVSPP